MSFDPQTGELDIFEEKSHSKLKYDFRSAIDADTGHQLKIVYSLDGINIGNAGANHNSERIMSNMTDEQKIHHIGYKGNTDHISSGQKVLAIIDLSNNKKLQSARVRGPFEYDNSEIFDIKVGETEDKFNYKSTFWPKSSKNKYSSNFPKDISVREVLGIGRGQKLNNVISKPYTIISDNNEYDNSAVGYNLNPSKKDIKKRNRYIQLQKELSTIHDELFNFKKEDKKSPEYQKLLDKMQKKYDEIDKLKGEIHLTYKTESNNIGEFKMKYLESVNGKVKDGYLSDLPEDIQKSIIEINKIIVTEVNELIKDDKYQDLHNSRWAMSCIDDFCTKPSSKDEVGSFRLFQKKKTYECMIQVTGHFRNHQYGWIEDLLNSFIKDLFFKVRPIIRKKFDMTLKSEGDMGNPEEGFDIYPNKKIAEKLWNDFQDRKTRSLKENAYNQALEDSMDSGILDEEVEEEKENNSDDNSNIEKTDNNSNESLNEGFFDIFKKEKKFKMGNIPFELLPEGLRNLCKDTTIQIKEELIKCASKLGFDKKVYKLSEGDTLDDSAEIYNINDFIDIIIGKYSDNINYIYKTSIALVDNKPFGHTNITLPISTNLLQYWNNAGAKEICDDVNKLFVNVYNNLTNSFKTSNPGKSLYLVKGGSMGEHDPNHYINIQYDEEYSQKLVDYINDPKNHPLTESADPESLPDYKKEYNTEMTETQAKKTLRTLSQGIINNYDDNMGKGKNKVTQYTANIYANIITKNLLPKWAPGYKKFSITLDSYQSFFTFEFKIPTMSQDFISRFIDGKEPMNAFLHRVPEIKVKVSPRIFHTMENPDDAFNFFKNAIQYYDKKVEKYANSLMHETFKLNHNMKHLIGTTKLSSIVTTPLRLLFVFDDVKMNDTNTFNISKEDISTINQFVKNIYTSYAAPEKEKKKIVEDMKNVVKELREQCDTDDNLKASSYLPEAVESFLFGKFDKEYNNADTKWIKENTDFEAMKSADQQTIVLYEKFGVKKLKKIPSDLIAYITIEAESIKDANDKMMIASYCCSKIEIVEWYIELLEVGSKKYVVPHTKPYLENIRTQLLQCYKKIMDTPIPKADRSIIDVKYPKGYEG